MKIKKCSVKTFRLGLAEGYDKAFEILDEKVLGLGEIEIQEIVDTLYPYVTNGADVCIVRRIIYIRPPSVNDTRKE